MGMFQVIVKQEITRKVGVGMTPEEEILRSKLENMQVLVSVPTQFKGRLSELLSQMRMQRNQWNNAVGNGYTLDKGMDKRLSLSLNTKNVHRNCLFNVLWFRFIGRNENVFDNATEGDGFRDRNGEGGHEITKNYHRRNEPDGVTPTNCQNENKTKMRFSNCLLWFHFQRECII